jgi:multidrug resistance efflux pump
MKRKIALWSAVVIAIVGAAAGAYALFFTPASVETVRAQTRDIVEFVVASGRLRAQTLSDLGTDVSGVVDTVAVRSGDRVEEGEVLVTLRPVDVQSRIDRERAALQTQREELDRLRAGPTRAELSSARADVSRAEAALGQAKSDFQRAKALLDSGVETPANVDAARTRYEQAKADLERAESQLELLEQGATREELRVARARVRQAEVALNATKSDLEKYTIVAPFAGLVTNVNANPGESVSLGGPLVTLAKMSDVEIYVEVDEDYLDRLRPGQPARVYFRSHPGRQFTAKLRQVGPEVDTERGIVGLHLVPDDLPSDAFPGLTADVNVEIAEHVDATAVPVTAIVQQRGAEPYVLAVRDSTAEKQEVEVVGEGDTWAAVDGIDHGTPVVLEAAKIDPGTRIESTEVAPEEIGDTETPDPPNAT